MCYLNQQVTCILEIYIYIKHDVNKVFRGTGQDKTLE